jgi:hypothetical protein
MIWSVCCTVDESSRKDMDNIVREIEPLFPPSDTIFEYYIKQDKRDFVSWTTLLSARIDQG